MNIQDVKSIMKVSDLYTWGQYELSSMNLESYEPSSGYILRQALHFNRAEFISNLDSEVDTKIVNKYIKQIKQFKSGIPLWKILKYVEFWGMKFSINKNVMIPRTETEVLVSTVLQNLENKHDTIKILDVGTGAGPIIISLAKEIKNSRCFGSEISAKALEVAILNSKKLLKRKNITFKEGSLLKPWSGLKFDIIVANLPYLPSKRVREKDLGKKFYEPAVSLNGLGNNGMGIYEQFLSDSVNHIEPKGAIFFEIGNEQKVLMKNIVKNIFPKADFRVIKDLMGLDRVAIIKL